MADTRAEKVRWLLANVPDPETGTYFTIPRAAAKMRELGYVFADNSLRNVCSGKVEEPSFRICEGIAKIFDISPVFFSSAASIQDLARQLAAAAILRDAQVSNLTFRAVKISPEVVDTAIAALEQFRAQPGPRVGANEAPSPLEGMQYETPSAGKSGRHRKPEGQRHTDPE